MHKVFFTPICLYVSKFSGSSSLLFCTSSIYSYLSKISCICQLGVKQTYSQHVAATNQYLSTCTARTDLKYYQHHHISLYFSFLKLFAKPSGFKLLEIANIHLQSAADEVQWGGQYIWNSLAISLIPETMVKQALLMHSGRLNPRAGNALLPRQYLTARWLSAALTSLTSAAGLCLHSSDRGTHQAGSSTLPLVQVPLLSSAASPGCHSRRLLWFIRRGESLMTSNRQVRVP